MYFGPTARGNKEEASDQIGEAKMVMMKSKCDAFENWWIANTLQVLSLISI